MQLEKIIWRIEKIECGTERMAFEQIVTKLAVQKEKMRKVLAADCNACQTAVHGTLESLIVEVLLY